MIFQKPLVCLWWEGKSYGVSPFFLSDSLRLVRNNHLLPGNKAVLVRNDEVLARNDHLMARNKEVLPRIIICSQIPTPSAMRKIH